jgi:acetyltransferase-like isoleucine patch superfamily enzyme
MLYRIQKLTRRTGRRLLYGLNAILPNRPTAELGARVSWRAKFEGVTRNIVIRSGACIREQAWLSCYDANSSIEIGSGTLIMPWTKLAAVGGSLRIGKNCTVHSFDVLYGFAGGLVIGDGVRIATHAVLVPGNHLFDDLSRPFIEQGASSKGIVIGDNVWIGAGVKVLDGVTVGAGAVLGAGTVVTRDVPKDAVCVGIPARCIRVRGQSTSHLSGRYPSVAPSTTQP